MAGTDETEEICTLRIELAESDPPIWREVEVPTAFTLLEVHEIVQRVMNWEDYHLWEFTIDKRRYGIDDGEDLFGVEPALDAEATLLRDILKPRRTQFRYLYDFGDSWDHKLIATKIRPAEANTVYPRLIGGEQNAPPEDSGGIWGFHDKLAVLRNPRDPEYRDLKAWFGRYNPATFPERRIKLALGTFAKARLAERKAASAKQRRRT